MKQIKRILVVSGATSTCRKAVQFGVALARCNGAELFVVHVVHNPFGYEGFNLPMISLDDSYERIIDEARRDLDRALAEERSKGLAIHSIIQEGEPTKVITKLVEDEKIDLLVMRAKQESRLEQLESRLEDLIFGKSYKDLVRTMPCTLVLVKDDA